LRLKALELLLFLVHLAVDLALQNLYNQWILDKVDQQRVFSPLMPVKDGKR
jgi:hypothetical protein